MRLSIKIQNYDKRREYFLAASFGLCDNMGMKIIVASFQYEACGKSAILPTHADFECAEGEEIFRKLPVREILEEIGAEVVPVLYANALPGGILPRALYEGFAEKILSAVRENRDAAGIYLCCHGSSEVAEIGSGELELVRRIRAEVGEKPLIAVSFDLHANIDVRLVPMVDIICGYKTAPHTDQAETQQAAARLLADALKGGYRPVVRLVKVPMLCAGDTMLTAEEPLKGLIPETVAAETGEVLRVNLFFSHMWIDAPNTCASVAVTAKNARIAESTAKVFAKKFWETRKKYRFLVPTGSVEECVKGALASRKGRVFLTDSGDNTTAGAEGNRTDILEAFLTRDTKGKRVCVSGITSPEILDACRGKAVGEEIEVPLACGARKGKILRFGKILGWAKDIIGESVTLEIGGISVVFTEKRSAFISEENFRLAGERLEDFDIVVVKLGYLFAELLPFCKKQYFVFSDGSSCVDIRRLGLKRIPRPMFPLDEFETEF